ncbi:hypothetical protein [Myroides sp. LJL119]
MEGDQIQRRIMALVAKVDKGNLAYADSEIESLRELINDELDQSTLDQQIVLLGKYLKILDQIEVRIK